MSEETTPTTEAVWESFSGRLLSWFSRRAPAGIPAEELVQESFLRIHRGLPGLADETRLGPWVYSIGRNVLTDSIRAIRRDASSNAALPMEAEPIDRATEDGVSASVHVAGWLEGFSRSLAPEDQSALELADFEGLPMRRVAEELGLSLSATKSRVQRARKKLARALLACCHLELDPRGGVVDWVPRRRCACDGS